MIVAAELTQVTDRRRKRARGSGRVDGIDGGFGELEEEDA